jgi:restriction system protein
MGYVREALAEPSQEVKGVVIALEDDPKLVRALSETPNISFYRYRLDFRLDG